MLLQHYFQCRITALGGSVYSLCGRDTRCMWQKNGGSARYQELDYDLCSKWQSQNSHCLAIVRSFVVIMEQQVNINGKRLHTVRQSISLCKSRELGWYQWNCKILDQLRVWALNSFFSKEKYISWVLQWYASDCSLNTYSSTLFKYTYSSILNVSLFWRREGNTHWGKGLYLSVSSSCNYTHCPYQLWEFPFQTIHFCPPSSASLSVTSSNKVGRVVMRLNY